eukprot:740852-Rhodomonas_salina.1
MKKDSTEEQIPKSDKELFNSFQVFFDSAFGATQFASWVVGNICLILSIGDSIYSPLPLRPSVVQIHMIVPMKDPILVDVWMDSADLVKQFTYERGDIVEKTASIIHSLGRFQCRK